MKASSSIVIGRKPVREILDERPSEIDSVYFDRDLSSNAVRDLQRLCADKGVAIKQVPSNKLNRLSEGANHQGIVAVVAPVTLEDLDEVLSNIAPRKDDVDRLKPLLVLPAEITDPHNLGAIVRSAVAFGASAILLPDRGTARLGATVLKASAGTALKVPFARVPNIRQALNRLKERGYWVAGLAGGGETTIDEMDWDRPLVVLVGRESKGLSPAVEKECDFLVSIPINREVDSLNASVATGIALQAASRCR